MEGDKGVRDKQRKKVYRAEWELGLQIGFFRSLRSTLKWAREVVQSDWWKINVGREVEFVLPKSNRRNAMCRFGKVCLPDSRWAWNKLVVLHELAHFIAGSLAKHNERFCGIMLELVEEFLGLRWAVELRKAYEKHGVRYEVFVYEWVLSEIEVC